MYKKGVGLLLKYRPTPIEGPNKETAWSQPMVLPFGCQAIYVNAL